MRILLMGAAPGVLLGLVFLVAQARCCCSLPTHGRCCMQLAPDLSSARDAVLLLTGRVNSSRVNLTWRLLAAVRHGSHTRSATKSVMLRWNWERKVDPLGIIAECWRGLLLQGAIPAAFTQDQAVISAVTRVIPLLAVAMVGAPQPPLPLQTFQTFPLQAPAAVQLSAPQQHSLSC